MTVWYDLGNFPGYRISLGGEILSLKQGEPKVMKTWIGDTGYWSVMLRRDGKYVNCKIHILLARTFIGPCPKGLQVCHDDGNKLNIALSNLYYGTPTQNNLDQVRHGTHPESSRTECDNGHAFTPDNIYWRPGHGKNKDKKYRKCKKCQVAATLRSRAKKKKAELEVLTSVIDHVERVAIGEDGGVGTDLSQGENTIIPKS